MLQRVISSGGGGSSYGGGGSNYTGGGYGYDSNNYSNGSTGYSYSSGSASAGVYIAVFGGVAALLLIFWLIACCAKKIANRSNQTVIVTTYEEPVARVQSVPAQINYNAGLGYHQEPQISIGLVNPNNWQQWGKNVHQWNCGWSGFFRQLGQKN